MTIIQDSENGQRCRAKNLTGGRCLQKAAIKGLCILHFRIIQEGGEIEITED